MEAVDPVPSSRNENHPAPAAQARTKVLMHFFITQGKILE
jgi:hypothetical protein